MGNYYRWDCAGFAELIRYGAFGWLPDYGTDITYFNDDYTDYYADYDRIRIGDVIRMDSATGGHSVVVIGIDGTKITVVEANFDGKISWDRVIDLEALRKRGGWFEVRSSYPQEP